MPSKGYDRIDGQLARTVNQAWAAPVDPTDFDLPIAYRAAMRGHVARRTAPANRDNGRMFAQQQRDLSTGPVVAFRDELLL